MKEKLLRSITILGSGILLSASLAVIIWINQSEETRLALREQFALEKIDQLGTSVDEKTLSGQQANSSEEQLFADIETLLSLVGSDDIPME